ncbi:hypothetical protein AAB992_07130 [Burkholderia contaminans]|uniref:hypothetical protein n=1 Tax=Burkholderia contaminans TaxID=488447 RepID=UPI0024163BD4|nr:hypothetical protein [Burkholderia contaminans]WFN13192.1 hypothetical protein LXE92_19705 [Burkholderia contaminans]
MKLGKLALAMGVTTALSGMAHTAQADTVSKKITPTTQINNVNFSAAGGNARIVSSRQVNDAASGFVLFNFCY